ncbi:hypothetical protein GCM10023317_15110 [Actinopolymorpha pittospori]
MAALDLVGERLDPLDAVLPGERDRADQRPSRQLRCLSGHDSPPDKSRETGAFRSEDLEHAGDQEDHTRVTSGPAADFAGVLGYQVVP